VWGGRITSRRHFDKEERGGKEERRNGCGVRRKVFLRIGLRRTAYWGQLHECAGVLRAKGWLKHKRGKSEGSKEPKPRNQRGGIGFRKTRGVREVEDAWTDVGEDRSTEWEDNRVGGWSGNDGET